MRGRVPWQMLRGALHAVYPPTCLACGALVQEDGALCGTCWRDTPFIAGPGCDGCGAPLMGTVQSGDLCDDCLTVARPWVQGRAALIYAGQGRRMVLSLKHGDQMHLAGPGGRWMARAAQPMVTPEMLVCAIPLHWRRRVTRRYNQSALLASALGRELGLEVCPDLLRRVRNTPSLGGSGTDARFRIMEQAITVSPRRARLMQGRPILLVDDVMTSGATLTAATLALLAAGAGPVRVVVLARAVKDA